jgi:hypothetical protein
VNFDCRYVPSDGLDAVGQSTSTLQQHPAIVAPAMLTASCPHPTPTGGCLEWVWLAVRARGRNPEWQVSCCINSNTTAPACISSDYHSSDGQEGHAWDFDVLGIKSPAHICMLPTVPAMASGCRGDTKCFPCPALPSTGTCVMPTSGAGALSLLPQLPLPAMQPPQPRHPSQQTSQEPAAWGGQVACHSPSPSHVVVVTHTATLQGAEVQRQVRYAPGCTTATRPGARMM